MPSKLWERIKLSENYATALKQIDERLIYWPSFLIHKCKQRLTRLVQVAIQSRRLAAVEKRLGEKLVGLPNKVRRRERTRERKALAAAKLERSIEKELVERLKSGAYGDKPLNVEENIWKKVLRGLERQGQVEVDVDEDELEVEGVEEEDEEEEDGAIEYVSGDEELEDEAEEMADLEDWLGGSGASDYEDSSEDEETDSEAEDESSESDAQGPKIDNNTKDDESRKRKRGDAVQQPRKRKYPCSDWVVRQAANIPMGRRPKGRNRVRSRTSNPGRATGVLDICFGFSLFIFVYRLYYVGTSSR